jgi:phenylacetic acid degradation operon negative regulatory protein
MSSLAVQPTPLSPAVALLVSQYHAAKPVRVWSLIVTLYGDAVVPRGGSLWIGSLIEIMDLFGIDAGHVRTAISRLSSDGWLDRVRRGRNSYYRLSKRGEGAFLAATRRIYAGEERRSNGTLRLALLKPTGEDRTPHRTALASAGFVPLLPTVYAGIADPPAGLNQADGVFVVGVEPGAGAQEIVTAAWKITPIVGSYRTFIDRFAPLDAALAARKALSGEEALVARTLLIHEFRRIVLRDPNLPQALLPDEWPGDTARALAARIYANLVSPAETYLDQVAQNEDGPLPAAGVGFHSRFATNG